MPSKETQIRVLGVRLGACTTALICALPLAACTSILGIEELSPEERGSSGGHGGNSGGLSASSGGGATGGTASGGLQDNTGGSGAVEATGGGNNNGGLGGVGGVGETGGTGGYWTTVEPGTVTGTLVDFDLLPIPDVNVTIVGVGSATTDDAGQFSIEDVPVNYDVEFTISAPNWSYAYRYEQLTRRDPTLQSFSAGNFASASVDVSYENIDTGSTNITHGWSPPGYQQYTDPPGGVGAVYDVNWSGWESIETTLHALQWGPSSSQPTYFSHAIQTATLNSDGQTMSVTLEDWLTINNSYPTRVEGGGGATPLAFLLFDDGAAIQLPIESVNFNRGLVEAPLIPNSHILLAFAESGTGARYSITHDVVVAGGEVSAPPRDFPEIEGPIDTTMGIEESSTFSWQPGSSSPCSLVKIENSSFSRGARIVTCDTETTLENLDLDGDQNHFWHVQTHGNYRDIDAMTGPEGFMDTFSKDDEFPFGTRIGRGYFARSAQWTFTTAP